MPRIETVAMIQMEVKPMDIEANFQKAVGYIRSAAEQGAKLAVLPEWHLTHFVNLRNIEKFASIADRWPEYLERYCQLARECRINVVPGTILQRQSGAVGPDSKFINTTYFINDEGKILGSYTKKNLWGATERKCIIRGRGPNVVIDTSIGRVGLLICFDLMFPYAFTELLAQGADMIIVPGHMRGFDGYPDLQNLSSNANSVMVDSGVVLQAFMANAAVIWVNAAGSPKRGYMISSQLAVPILGTVSKTAGPEEQMQIARIDLDILRTGERMYEFRNELQRQLATDAEYPYRAPAILSQFRREEEKSRWPASAQDEQHIRSRL